MNDKQLDKLNNEVQKFEKTLKDLMGKRFGVVIYTNVIRDHEKQLELAKIQFTIKKLN